MVLLHWSHSFSLTHAGTDLWLVQLNSRRNAVCCNCIPWTQVSFSNNHDFCHSAAHQGWLVNFNTWKVPFFGTAIINSWVNDSFNVQCKCVNRPLSMVTQIPIGSKPSGRIECDLHISCQWGQRLASLCPLDHLVRICDSVSGSCVVPKVYFFELNSCEWIFGGKTRSVSSVCIIKWVWLWPLITVH